MTTAEPTLPDPPHPLTVGAGARFTDRIRRLGLHPDPAQDAAVARLAGPARHGFYLWGPVGRGKTVIAEAYLAALAPAAVRRFHFHGFFRALQRELFGTGAGLVAAIDTLIGPARAVLFDEFHVHDVADAVYLTAVLRRFRERGVLLIATSNYAPADLFPDPLHHHRFLPAIAMIERDLEVVPLGDGHDHRTTAAPAGAGFAAGSWSTASAAVPATTPVALDPDGVALAAVAVDGRSAQFTFAQLCEAAVGAHQYLWLADRFDRITVVGMPDPATVRREPLHRFTVLVDVLHDRDTALEVHADGPPERMREAPVPPRDLARTLSRLSLLRR
ncbi:cell division protein ZapE [Microbacterium sp. GXF7504]